MTAATLSLSGLDLAAHRGALLRFARRKVRDDALAEDAVQDALLAAVRSVHRFEGQSTLRTWLIGILNHKIQDAFRRETRYVPLAGDSSDDAGDPDGRIDAVAARAAQSWLREASEDPLREVAERRLRTALESEVDALPQTLREVFRLQALEGMETAEVCQRLQISESNCWVRLHRARKRLAERMRAHLD